MGGIATLQVLAKGLIWLPFGGARVTIEIIRYADRHREHILELSLRAWAPVFPQLADAVPSYVYRAFYPDGWEERQVADIGNFLQEEGRFAWVAIDQRTVVGWIGIRLHAADSMGEIYILAVDPDRQREGISTSLMNAAMDYMRTAGMEIVMVETGDDPGHAASRATYEHNGFERWPVARYFREL